MNKSELVAEINSQLPSITKEATQAVVDSVFQIIIAEVSSGNKVSIKDVATFEPRVRAATTKKNPKTGEDVDVPAHRVVSFKPSKFFKEQVYPLNPVASPS